MSDVHRHLDTSLGLFFVGDMVSAVLVGFGLCQAFVYFTRYPKDRLFIKFLVALTMVCEVVHQGLISYTLYWYTITNYDNPAVLSNVIWSIVILGIPTAIIIFVVQSFFIRRIWHLSQKARFLAVVLFITVVVESTFSMVLVGKFVKFKAFAEFTSYKTSSITPISLAAAIDVIIAVVLVTALHCSRTGMKRTDSMINLLILFAMSTGLVTAIWAVGTSISIALTGVSFIDMFFYYILGRLYFNSLLSSLNARHSIRAAGLEETISFIGTKPQSTGIRVIIEKFATSSVDAISADEKSDKMVL